MLESLPDGRAALEELCDQVSAALLMTGEQNEVIDSAVMNGEQAFIRRMNIRRAARAAFMDADAESKVRRALHARSRTQGEPMKTGDLAYVWRKAKKATCHHWHGPGHVLGTQGSRVWVTIGPKVYWCSVEQFQRPSEEQEAMIRLLPEHLRVIRNTVAERGAGNVVVLEGGNLPPKSEMEPNMSHAEEPGQGEARGVFEKV